MTTVRTTSSKPALDASAVEQTAVAKTPAPALAPATPSGDPGALKGKVTSAMARWEKLRATRLSLEAELEKVSDQESDIAREVKALVGTSFRYKGALISITERKDERAYFRGFGKQPSLVEIE